MYNYGAMNQSMSGGYPAPFAGYSNFNGMSQGGGGGPMLGGMFGSVGYNPYAQSAAGTSGGNMSGAVSDPGPAAPGTDTTPSSASTTANGNVPYELTPAVSRDINTIWQPPYYRQQYGNYGAQFPDQNTQIGAAMYSNIQPQQYTAPWAVQNLPSRLSGLGYLNGGRMSNYGSAFANTAQGPGPRDLGNPYPINNQSTQSMMVQPSISLDGMNYNPFLRNQNGNWPWGAPGGNGNPTNSGGGLQPNYTSTYGMNGLSQQQQQSYGQGMSSGMFGMSPYGGYQGMQGGNYPMQFGYGRTPRVPQPPIQPAYQPTPPWASPDSAQVQPASPVRAPSGDTTGIMGGSLDQGQTGDPSQQSSQQLTSDPVRAAPGDTAGIMGGSAGPSSAGDQTIAQPGYMRPDAASGYLQPQQQSASPAADQSNIPSNGYGYGMPGGYQFDYGPSTNDPGSIAGLLGYFGANANGSVLQQAQNWQNQYRQLYGNQAPGGPKAYWP